MEEEREDEREEPEREDPQRSRTTKMMNGRRRMQRRTDDWRSIVRIVCKPRQYFEFFFFSQSLSHFGFVPALNVFLFLVYKLIWHSHQYLHKLEHLEQG